MRCPRCGGWIATNTAVCSRCGAGSAAPSGAPLGESVSDWLEGQPAGRLAGKRFRFATRELCVGRDPGNAIHIDDPEISRRQARFYRDAEGQPWLEDLSANGTFVNSRRVRQARLSPGDEIRFGAGPAYCLIYRQNGHAAAPAPIRPPAVEVARGAAVQPALRPKPAHPWLQLILDQYVVQDIPLSAARLEIGSQPAPGGLSIPHPSVRPRHAELLAVGDGGWKLRQISPEAATRINGQRVSERLLQDGDIILLGKCENRLLLYRDPERRPLSLREIALGREITRVGRDPENEVSLRHPTVSRFHAVIRKTAAGTELEDHGSTNGTFVNGVRIRRQWLHAGDRIMIGAVPLDFDGAQMAAQSDENRFRLSCRGLGQSVIDLQTGQPRQLLDAIALVIQPRELVGILGPSGCGKSTLLDALNGLRPAREGWVQINNWDLYRDYAALRPLIGHVPQDDILHSELNVRECLHYTARLRLPTDTGESEIEARVTEVLEILELGERAELGISSLSGGQRKRVSLGIELLSKPGLLFLDEPTAGQDPRTEMKMMQTFREIANRGATVVLSTHLLGSFSLLDKVAVLVGGRLAYFGPGQQLLAYFRQSRPADIYDCLQQHSPAEWAEQYLRSEQYHEIVARCLDESAPGPASASALIGPVAEVESGGAARSWSQFQVLSRRQFRLRWTGLGRAASLLLPPAVVAGLMDLLKGGADGPKTLFMIVFAALWFGGSACVRELVDERQIFRRERQHGLSLAAYLGSKLAYALGLGALQTAAFVGVLMFGGALQGHLLQAWGMMLLLYWNGALLGLLISALVKRPDTALLLFPLLLIPQLLLAGLFIPVRTLQGFYARLDRKTQQVQVLNLPLAQPGMPAVLRWGISPLMVSRWGLEGLADLYLHDGRPHSFKLANMIAISLHPRDAERLRAWLAGMTPRDYLNPPDPRPRLGSAAYAAYMAILGGIAGVMIAITAAALRWQTSP